MNVTILPPAYQGDPEALAMLQAFYSRSTEPIQSRIGRLGGDLEKVKASLKTYYVGYGHRSIAQCATVTVFVEGVSILAAKYLQDSPLYNGQECSTRYIDIGPNTYEGRGKRWVLRFKRVLEALQQAAPAFLGVEDTDKVGMRAAQAWCFDRARCLLPTSLLTNLSVTMTLDAWSTHLSRLNDCHHKEVRDTAQEIYRHLRERFPSAATINPTWGRIKELPKAPEFGDFRQEVSMDFSSHLQDILAARKAQGSRLPLDLTLQQAKAEISLRVKGTIDYGSWRDLQRHRPSNVQMTEPQAGAPFYEPYLLELKKHLPSSVYYGVISEIEKGPEGVYDMPLGTAVTYDACMPLTQAVYLVETRCQQTVHFTLREHAQALATSMHREGYETWADMSPTVFSYKRGSQTIEANSNR